MTGTEPKKNRRRRTRRRVERPRKNFCRSLRSKKQEGGNRSRRASSSAGSRSASERDRRPRRPRKEQDEIRIARRRRRGSDPDTRASTLPRSPARRRYYIWCATARGRGAIRNTSTSAARSLGSSRGASIGTGDIGATRVRPPRCGSRSPSKWKPRRSQERISQSRPSR